MNKSVNQIKKDCKSIQEMDRFKIDLLINIQNNKKKTKKNGCRRQKNNWYLPRKYKKKG